MNTLTVVEPPTDPVVTLDDVRMHLRWDDDGVGELDVLLEGYIEAAVQFVEQATRRALAPQTLRISGSSFRGLELLHPPFRELVDIDYLNEEGVPQTQDLADFFVTDGLVPSVVAYTRVNDACTDIARRADAVRVTYRAGYDAGKVPKGLKVAVLLQVQLLADRFDTNEKADLERTRDALLSPFRVHNF